MSRLSLLSLFVPVCCPSCPGCFGGRGYPSNPTHPGHTGHPGHPRWFRWFLLPREPRINGDAIRCIGLCALEIGMVLKSSGIKFGMVVGCFGLT